MKEGSMDNKPTMKNRIIKYTESKRQRKKKELFGTNRKTIANRYINHINSIKCNCSKTAIYMERLSHWKKKK